MNWRPIKTAPKDGTHILLCYPRFDGEGNTVTQGRWVDLPHYNHVKEFLLGQITKFSNRKGWTVAYVAEVSHGGARYQGNSFKDSGCFVEPTHWQPLPKPCSLKK